MEREEKIRGTTDKFALNISYLLQKRTKTERKQIIRDMWKIERENRAAETCGK